MLATGALTLIFTSSRETSDFWADALKMWWGSVSVIFRASRERRDLGGDAQKMGGEWVKVRGGQVKRLVIYLDNGRKNSGTRTQWKKRRVDFSDLRGWEIRLVSSPPYHSKYN